MDTNFDFTTNDHFDEDENHNSIIQGEFNEEEEEGSRRTRRIPKRIIEKYGM